MTPGIQNGTGQQVPPMQAVPPDRAAIRVNILSKRFGAAEVLRGVHFSVARGEAFGPDDVERLLQDAGIIRHRGKIGATINNAQRAIEMVDAEGSLVDWIWEWAVTDPDRAAKLREALAAATGE